MKSELPLILNLTLALAVAFAGGVIARRLGLPTLIGYLGAGIIIGPFTPGFVGDTATLSQFAELGVIFLLFGVGLHFSLSDLWAVRRIAVPGSIAQLVIVTALGFGLARAWGWSASAGLLLGVAVSIASTVVLLRALADNGLLNSDAARVAIGWLVLEDLATVLVLVVLPTFTPGQGGLDWLSVGAALLKAVAFAALMLVGGRRVVPWVLLRVAHTRSRELFILAVVVVTVGTALAAAELFGVSLALGAFLAGVVVHESALSQQVGAEVLPFRETFAVLFFVSVGMLVDPAIVTQNPWHILLLVVLIVVGKAALTALSGFVLPSTGRTILIVALGRAQIGEFSFLLGQAGMQLGILTRQQYALILAAAVVSILLNPFVFRALPLIEGALRTRAPSVWRLLDRHGPALEPPAEAALANHVIVVGYGRVGRYVVAVLKRFGIPQLVVEFDVELAGQLQRQGVPTLYGDAADSDVLAHAGLARARALVVTVPDEAAAEVVVAGVHDRAPSLPIVVRASTRAGVGRLRTLGASAVIFPELEGGLEVMRYTLLNLGFPTPEVDEYVDVERHTSYNDRAAAREEQGALEDVAAWRVSPVDEPVTSGEEP